MPIIRNKLNNRILIQLKGDRSIDLLEKSAVEITDDDLLSSHLQDLIQRGFVIKEKEAKKEVGNEGELEDPKKEKETKSEVDEDLSDENEIKNKKDEDLNKEKEANENTKKENEVNEDLCKEMKVKTETDEKSELNKSSNTKRGK
jgi:hypothetical protein